MSGTLLPEVLVLGGAGNVGQGVVAALLEAGSPVLAVGRDPAHLAQLRQQFADEPALDTLRGSFSSDADAAVLAAQIAQRERPLSAVIACLGSPLQRGRLLDRPVTDLLQRFERDVIPHLAAARHLLPLVAQAGGSHHGRYVLIGSPCALRAWSGHGDTSVAAAAVRMLAQVLHEEAQTLGVRLQLLDVALPVCTPTNARNACSEWPSALAVGRRAVALLDRRAPGNAIVSDRGGHVPAPSQMLHPDDQHWPWRVDTPSLDLNQG